MNQINRREFVAAVPLLGLAAAVAAQTAAPQINLPPPTLQSSILAEGLGFPEAPVVMKDGSVLFVQIQAKKISRLTPDGRVTLVKQLEGGPNGLAIGPDKALYIANNGGRFAFAERAGFNFVSGTPPEHTGGAIQRLDLKTGALTTLYETCEGKRLVAPDDLVFDHHGGMWISDIGKTRTDGGLYYATYDGRKIVSVRQMGGPNGIGLSPDGKQLHVSANTQLWTFDIAKPGVLGVSKSYAGGEHAKLREQSFADSLKVQADGKVCVCTLRAGGISIIDAHGATQFIQLPDPYVTNLAFGGKDMRDVWLTLSGTSRLAKVRWPYPGLKPAYSA